ncbi:MAG: beta propeller repeat protein, partial [Dehalococcoidales bacterium]
MKRVFKKFWGVIFVVVLLSTLLVGAVPQATAGELSFTYANLPGGLVGGVFGGLAVNLQSICANTTTIRDFAVAGDGLTIYAATNVGPLKSTNAGRTWVPLFIDLTFITDFVAVAPDNPNIVAYVNQAARTVAISKDGGVSFSVSDRLRSRAGTLAANVTDVAIAQKAIIEGNLVSLVAVTGENGTGAALYYYPMN